MDGELLSIRTWDGKNMEVTGLHATVRFLTYGGFGAPPINYVTHRGYLQAGETFEAAIPQPRQLTVHLWRDSRGTRLDYWNARETLLAFFGNNRNGPLTLTVLLPGGEYRCIDAYPDPGLVFGRAGDDQSIWQIDDLIQFTAFDPIWYDPEPITFNFSPHTQDALIFPITFPITFGVSGSEFRTGVIAYDGTWPAWLWIKINGPYSYARLTELSSGAELVFKIGITEGQYRYLDIRNVVRIFDEQNVSRIDELSSESDVVNFKLNPVPAASQEFQIVLSGQSDQSACLLTYYRRFVGI